MNKSKPPVDFDENPEWTESTTARSRPASEVHPPHVAAALTRKAGRPRGSEKRAISIRLDEDVLAKFKATGPGWQGRINEALRRARL